MKVSKVVKYEANFAKGVLVTAEKLNTTVTDTQCPKKKFNLPSIELKISGD